MSSLQIEFCNFKNTCAKMENPFTELYMRSGFTTFYETIFLALYCTKGFLSGLTTN